MNSDQIVKVVKRGITRGYLSRLPSGLRNRFSELTEPNVHFRNQTHHTLELDLIANHKMSVAVVSRVLICWFVDREVNFKFQAYVPDLYDCTLKRLKAADIDQEVKERAISCM